MRVLPPNLRLLATTATANARVTADLEAILGPNLQVSRGDLDRPSLALQTIRMPGQAERLAWLAETLPSLPGSGIVYTLTVRDAELVAAWLLSRGIAVAAYTGETGPNRTALEQALLDNQVKALVATTALGMGFDKPDLAVRHPLPDARLGRGLLSTGRPRRAGARNGPRRAAQRRGGHRDHELLHQKRLSHAERGGTGSGGAGGRRRRLTPRRIEARVNISAGRIQKTLQLLSLESPAPIVRQGASWQLTAASLSDAFWDRAERLTALRREEQADMQKYVPLSSGHMAFLIRALDGDPRGSRRHRCRRCPSRAVRKWWPRRSPSCAVRACGGTAAAVASGKRIDPAHRAQPGRVLCVWNDAGWGQLVSRGKLQDERFPNELVGACAALLREWRPDRRPPGSPPFRHCGIRVSCPTSRAVSPMRWTCRSATC